MEFTFNKKRYRWNYKQFARMMFEIVSGTAAVMAFDLGIVYAFIGGF